MTRRNTQLLNDILSVYKEDFLTFTDIKTENVSYLEQVINDLLVNKVHVGLDWKIYKIDALISFFLSA